MDLIDPKGCTFEVVRPPLIPFKDLKCTCNELLFLG